MLYAKRLGLTMLCGISRAGADAIFTSGISASWLRPHPLQQKVELHLPLVLQGLYL
jgi:hypothetical protein